MTKLLLERLHWRDVKDDVKKVNPELFETIEHINPPDDCYLYKTSYQYGDYFCRKGVFQIPTANGLKVFSKVASKELLDELNYNYPTHPAGLTFNKCIDCFAELDDRVIPLFLFQPGEIFGIGIMLVNYKETIHTGSSVWDMTTGCRSVFMLPKISQAHKYKNLRRLTGHEIETPKTMLEHFGVFKELATAMESNWRSDVLFFGHKWFERMHKEQWKELELVFYKTLHERLKFWANIFPWDLSFSQALAKRNIKHVGSIANYVKQIFAVSTGQILAHQPSTNDDKLPLQSLQEIFVEKYRLKEYNPIIFEGDTYKNKPIYLSPQFPTIDNTPNMDKLPSTVTYLDDIAYHFNRTMSTFKTGRLDFQWTPVVDLMENIEVNFYHPFNQDHKNIYTIEQLLQTDSRLTLSNFPSNNKFPDNARFMNGCIQLRPKTSAQMKKPVTL